MQHAVYPGSFDPITHGHLDIIRRGCQIFDQLTVAVLQNPSKIPLFSAAERMEMIRCATQEIAVRVEISSFDGLLVDYADRIGADVILRGLRAVSDFEFEFQLSLMNRRLNPRINTIYLMACADLTYLSSGLVKEIYALGGNVTGLVPDCALLKLEEKRTSASREIKECRIESSKED